MTGPSDDVPDADAEMVAGAQPPSARRPLDRERIVSAAVSFIAIPIYVMFNGERFCSLFLTRLRLCGFSFGRRRVSRFGFNRRYFR